MPTLGVELEMPVVEKKSGSLYAVKDYFQALHAIKKKRDENCHLIQLGGLDHAVLSNLVVSSVDNAYNNLESAIGPINNAPNGLDQLQTIIHRELVDITTALTAENAAVINFAQHPFALLDQNYYLAVKSPKPIYKYLTDYRKWSHYIGVDAKAHNGPTTGTSFDKAIAELNTLIGLSAAFIALYANSPFEGGRLTGLQENRQMLWLRMFASSRFTGDVKLAIMPDAPFKDLRHYLTWMFGPGTHMHVVPACHGGDYKKSSDLMHVQGDVPLLDFLQAKSWGATDLDGRRQTRVQPTIQHMEFQQFAQFLDVRIRYRFKEEFKLEHFLSAWKSGLPLEDLFAKYSDSCYLEGRAAGANFPDRELVETAGNTVCRSMVISPSAIQFGLLRQLEQAWELIESYSWETLKSLKKAAIRDGLHATVGKVAVKDLCKEVIDIAGMGLYADQAWMLAYPEYVLKTGQTGADRAIALFQRLSGSTTQRLQQLALQRCMVPPDSM